jgi:hypothetical protein
MSENGSQKKPPKRAGKKNAASSVTSPPSDRFAVGYDFLLLNSEILGTTFAEVMKCVTSHRANDKVVLILVTYGGDANTSYRIGRFLQTIYKDDLVAFTPAQCKSAGTLLITAANSIIFSPFGEIGPLDVPLIQRDELVGQRSGLTTRSALEDLKAHSFELFEHIMQEVIKRSGSAISFRLAADIAGRMSSRLLARVYQQINPADLGQDNRDLNVALRYGERLNKRFANLKAGGLKHLVYDYPSHDFVIDLEEARTIFERVELPTRTLINMMGKRMNDCLVPKTGRNHLIKMLTPDGQYIEPASQAGPIKKASTPTAKGKFHGQSATRGRNGSGEAATS